MQQEGYDFVMMSSMQLSRIISATMGLWRPRHMPVNILVHVHSNLFGNITGDRTYLYVTNMWNEESSTVRTSTSVKATLCHGQCFFLSSHVSHHGTRFIAISVRVQQCNYYVVVFD